MLLLYFLPTSGGKQVTLSPKSVTQSTWGSGRCSPGWRAYYETTAASNYKYLGSVQQEEPRGAFIFFAQEKPSLLASWQLSSSDLLVWADLDKSLSCRGQAVLCTSLTDAIAMRSLQFSYLLFHLQTQVLLILQTNWAVKHVTTTMDTISKPFCVEDPFSPRVSAVSWGVGEQATGPLSITSNIVLKQS